MALELSLLAASLAACSCSSTRCPVSNAAASVRLSYSTGGLVPLETHLYLFPDGVAKLVTPGPERRCRDLDPGAEDFLIAKLEEPSVQAALDDAAEMDYESSVADVEEIRVWVPGREVMIPADEVPPAVADFVDALEAVFHAAFGAAFQGLGLNTRNSADGPGS